MLRMFYRPVLALSLLLGAAPAMAGFEYRIFVHGIRGVEAAPGSGAEPTAPAQPAVSVGLTDLTGTSLSEVGLGPVAIGAHSALTKVKLANTGSTPLTFSGPRIQLEAPFHLLAEDCGAALAGGSSCTLTLRAAPTEVKQYVSPVTVTHTGGSLSAGNATTEGVPAAVVVASAPATLSVGPNVQISGVIRLRNLTGSSIAADSQVTGFSGPIQANVGTGTVPANGTVDVGFRFIGGTPGTYQVPITFRTKVGSTYVPLTTATIAVTVTASPYANHATETMYEVTAQSPLISQVNFSGSSQLSYYPGISNLYGTPPQALRAIKVTVPTSAVSSLLTMQASGTKEMGGAKSTLNVYEGSPSGTLVYSYGWGGYSMNVLSTTVLQAGKTYYVVPQSTQGGASTQLGYVELAWN